MINEDEILTSAKAVRIFTGLIFKPKEVKAIYPRDAEKTVDACIADITRITGRDFTPEVADEWITIE